MFFLPVQRMAWKEEKSYFVAVTASQIQSSYSNSQSTSYKPDLQPTKHPTTASTCAPLIILTFNINSISNLFKLIPNLLINYPTKLTRFV